MRSSASLLALLLAGCGATQVAPTASGPAARLTYGAFDETGPASWYGEELAGQLTASGEPFDPAALTVAHRTLPLGSLVEVTALGTDRSVIARVTDRGPGRLERVVDLSRAAAQAIGLDRQPQSEVRVRSVANAARYAAVRGPALPARIAAPAGSGPWIVQVASFSYRRRAEALADALHAGIQDEHGLHRVRLGPFDRLADAERARDDAARRGYGDAAIFSAQ